ncbi:sugar nucleotide-binding protein [Pelagibacterales bacterium SAG-MED19]|nr:sugar nucleotide-binding protein [Pelagibacterales bacterium SAG-MED19]
MKKIIVTGGTGRFGSILKKYKTKHEIIFPTKNQLDILNIKKARNYLNKLKPNILIHLAGLSRPMKVHNTNIQKSIDLNIIGTANITKVCAEKNIKLIYFSTNYVYQGSKGNYKESDSLLPVNNYAWSKLGGESSVQLYKNSLILRLSMMEKPFVHKQAFANVKSSFLYHDEVAKILFKILNKKGVLNIGGVSRSVYEFAKKSNSVVKKIYLTKKINAEIPKNSSLNISKLKNILKKK